MPGATGTGSLGRLELLKIGTSAEPDITPGDEITPIGLIGYVWEQTPHRTAVRSVTVDGRRKPGVVRGRRLPLLYFAAVRIKKGHFPIMGCGL
ncbi:hypothetical protein [Sphaerisporangium flaviroseum]|uniref:hypothetical protein n=1 Tax=Sphaerisporangium flaviroseum TaxID=509199 RepID=UPI0031E96FE6